MKKMTFWSMMMLVAMIMPLVACGSDDDDATDGDLVKKAVGVWMCTQSTDKTAKGSYDGLMVGKEVRINANGTYSSTSSSFGHTGTYTIKGNQITAKNSTGDTFVVTVSISGDRMTWNGTSSTGVTFRYVFTRETGAEWVFK